MFSRVKKLNMSWGSKKLIDNDEHKKSIVKDLIKTFYPFAKQKLGFNKPVRLFLRNDIKNSENPLGKTGFYSPQECSITVYITDRHPKDIIKSISHELIHHKQNCEGRLGNINSENVTQSKILKNIEDEAYSEGDKLFREFEDTYKAKNKKLMENLNMSEKKEGEYSGDITENDTIKEYYVKRAGKVAEHVANRFGFKFDLEQSNIEDKKGGDSK